MLILLQSTISFVADVVAQVGVEIPISAHA